MGLSLFWMVSLALSPLASDAATSNYSEASAIKYAYLSISAYCGAPKFETPQLEGWSCGPSCQAAGEVTDITTFAALQYGVFGFVGRSQGSCLLAFRGTYDDAGTTLDEDMDLTAYAGCSGCKIHQGLHDGYFAVKDAILQALGTLQCSDVSITGHSLGGSLTMVATFDLGTKYTIKENYNFGAYRVGNTAFANAYDAKYLPVTFRVTHKKDPIPLGPPHNFEHVGGEIYYPGDVSEGYKICEGHEDLSCIAQYCKPGSCSWFKLDFFALGNSASHLSYMTPTIQIKTDGESCKYVAVDRVAQQAYLATAAYCPAKDLKTWNCGKPCDKVKGGVESVETLHVPFKIHHHGAHFHGVLKGFVGKWDHSNDGCILSLADPFGKKGLSILEEVDDMVDTGLGDRCPDCKISKIVKHAYHALKEPLRKALTKVGCVATADSAFSRRLAVTGHGIGAPIASFAAFDMQNGTGYTKGSFGVESSFSFGSPRLGNDKWVTAFHARLGGSIDRITHHKDPYAAYPSKDKGFEHDEGEIFVWKCMEGEERCSKWWYNTSVGMSGGTSYVRCTEKNQRCGEWRYNASVGSLEDHMQYMQPMVEVNIEKESCGQSVITLV